MKWRPLKRGYTDRIEELKGLRPHQLLEVEEHPSESELKRAYRAKVKAYHPDRLDPFLRSQAQEILKLINSAYETLLMSCRR